MSEKVVLLFPRGLLPPLPWSLVPSAQLQGWNSPGPGGHICRKSWGLWRSRSLYYNSREEDSARAPSLSSLEPLYTKQPPQSGLDFREAVSEEAASRDFSMCFQVKSKPFQLCQETTPTRPLHSGCLQESGPQGRGLQTPAPTCRTFRTRQTESCPHPGPGTFPSSYSNPGAQKAAFKTEV